MLSRNAESLVHLLPTSYLRQIPGLKEAVAACPPTTDHAPLVALLADQAALAGARLATTRGDRWLATRKIYTRDGALLAVDHEAWLADQVAQDGNDARKTFTRLKDAGHRVTQCAITSLYVVASAPPEGPSRFLQAEIEVEDEVLDRELLEPHPWRTPDTFADLLLEQGPVLRDHERTSMRPPAYRLHRIIDVEAWLNVADALEDVRREAFRSRRYQVTGSAGHETATPSHTADRTFPGWDHWLPKHRRLFQDWGRSSARDSRLCDHWAMDLRDHTDAGGHRTLSMVPLWAFSRPLDKVDASQGSDDEFYGALLKLDRHVGVPFGWFFYMVHGNRVEADAGNRVIRAAEDGTIVLPEHDYRVLKDWEASPYAF